jgi:hypothetical protein
MRERWLDNFYVQRDQVLSSAPYPVRVVVGWMIYRSHCQTLHGQGVARYSADEARGFREEIWTRLNGLLEESMRKSLQKRDDRDDESCFWCLGGDEPTECDTTLYGFINSALVAKR